MPWELRFFELKELDQDTAWCPLVEAETSSLDAKCHFDHLRTTNIDAS